MLTRLNFTGFFNEENLELTATDYVNSMLENFFELLQEYGIFNYFYELDIDFHTSTYL
jgi:hypothetical protein